MSRASSRLNLSDHFLSRSEILVSVEVVNKPWSVDEVAGGWLVEDFTDLSDLTGLSDFTDLTDEDFFSAFLSSFFLSTGPLKPEELWPSTTPTTDTSAGVPRNPPPPGGKFPRKSFTPGGGTPRSMTPPTKK